MLLNNKRSRSKRRHKNPRWKGEKVGYGSLHEWIKRRKEKPRTCEKCHSPGWLDLANKNHSYTRDISQWEWLCRKCHMWDDGRIEKIKKARKNQPGPWLNKKRALSTKQKISKKIKKFWQNPKYRKHMSEAHKGQHSSPSTQFKKGHIPWNKKR